METFRRYRAAIRIFSSHQHHQSPRPLHLGRKASQRLLVRENLNVFQLPRHDPGALTQAVHRIARRIELAGERADHVTVFVEFALYRAEKLPDLARPLLQGQRPKSHLE